MILNEVYKLLVIFMKSVTYHQLTRILHSTRKIIVIWQFSEYILNTDFGNTLFIMNITSRHPYIFWWRFIQNILILSVIKLRLQTFSYFYEFSYSNHQLIRIWYSTRKIIVIWRFAEYILNTDFSNAILNYITSHAYFGNALCKIF